ncbi:MAG TPA: hypothetical protein VGA50_17620 [Kiloniellales bacterium]|jgi:hypothetical protein
MAAVAQGIKALFSAPKQGGLQTKALALQEQQLVEGRASRARQEEISRGAREQQEIQLARQRQELQREDATSSSALRTVRRPPPGRRLLLAATGEAGLRSTLG